AVGPKVRAADARHGCPDDGIGRLDDFWRRPLLESNVARTVKNCSVHDFRSCGYADRTTSYRIQSVPPSRCSTDFSLRGTAVCVDGSMPSNTPAILCRPSMP